MAKRILCMQDIACFGKCSMTVALPVISAAGVECVPLPTMLLSAHTGGLGEVHLRNLYGDIPPIIKHWLDIGISFDGIYIGYLGSSGLCDLAKEVVKAFKGPGTFVLLDPAMGDSGTLYRRLDAAYAAKTAELAALADYCLPNLTEAALLAGIGYTGESPSPQQLEALTDSLSRTYPAKFVITGVETKPRQVCAVVAAASGSGPAPVFYAANRHTGRFHGAGDVFAGVTAAALARGLTIESAAAAAVDFVAAVVKRTALRSADERFGLDFESCLHLLPNLLSDGVG